jgi:hypothetical protein
LAVKNICIHPLVYEKFVKQNTTNTQNQTGLPWWEGKGRMGTDKRKETETTLTGIKVTGLKVRMKSIQQSQPARGVGETSCLQTGNKRLF